MSQDEISIHGVTYRLVPLCGTGLAPLVPLFRTTYNRRDFTLDWLERKYGGSFGGVEGFSYTALTERGEAAAACGMLPWPIRFGDRVEVGMQVVDAATHSQHRRRGLFARLLELGQERGAAAGASFFFAFPQPGGDSYPGFVDRFGYSDVGRHHEYQRPIRTLWVERLARRVPLLRSTYARALEHLFAPFTALEPAFENSLLRDGFASTDRSPAFLAYKSFTGSRVLHVDGGRVWIKVRHGIQIGDIEAQSAEDLTLAVRSLEHLAARAGVHRVTLHAANATRMEHFFRSRYRGAPSVALVHRDVRSRIPADRLRFSLGDLDNF